MSSERPTASRLFAEAFDREPWVWKDVRNCLLLPFWLATLDTSVAIVLVVRNPLEAAQSLRAIEGPTEPLSLALWERYMRTALNACTGLPVLVSTYDALLRDPESWSRAALTFLLDHGFDVDVRPGGLASVLDARLRHHRSDRLDIGSSEIVSREQAQLFEILLALVGTHEAFACRSLPPETPHTGWLIQERRRADCQLILERQRTNRQRERLRGCRAKLESQRRKLERQKREIDALRERINQTKQPRSGESLD